MKALLFNDSPESEDTFIAVRDVILVQLQKHEWVIHELVLRNEKMAFCTGCFGCWTKTPGECVINDAGRGVAKAIMESDLVIMLTPVTFGGYSSELKKALDRMIPILMPFFVKIGGEVHHEKRYSRYPRMMAVGILGEPDDESARTFQTLHARNAINAYAPDSTSCTIVTGSDTAEIKATLHTQLSKMGVGP